jgi:molybdopterin converting factor small subunit
MATVIFSSGLRQLTGASEEVHIEAANYRAAIRELRQQFPELTDSVLEKFGIAIDGVMIHSPLLETFGPNSELVFIPKIAGG